MTDRSTPALPALQLPLNGFADELGATFALVKHGVDALQRPLGKSGRGAFVVDLLPTHAATIDDITYCYKPYFSLASAWIDDIIYPSERRRAMFHIYNNEKAKELPYIVFWTRNGKTERAAHLGKRGTFRTLEEAKQAVHNAEHYGTQNV